MMLLSIELANTERDFILDTDKCNFASSVFSRISVQIS